MTRTEEILTAVLLEMHVCEIEDTNENRLEFLINLRNKWLIGPKYRTDEKRRYLGAINIEILTIELMIEQSSKI
jgi:hypothetical protein